MRFPDSRPAQVDGVTRYCEGVERRPTTDAACAPERTTQQPSDPPESRSGASGRTPTGIDRKRGARSRNTAGGGRRNGSAIHGFNGGARNMMQDVAIDIGREMAYSSQPKLSRR